MIRTLNSLRKKRDLTLATVNIYVYVKNLKVSQIMITHVTHTTSSNQDSEPWGHCSFFYFSSIIYTRVNYKKGGEKKLQCPHVHPTNKSGLLFINLRVTVSAPKIELNTITIDQTLDLAIDNSDSLLFMPLLRVMEITSLSH